MNDTPGAARQYAVGVQSFTYREFDVEGMCSALESTGVTAVELCHEHVTPDHGDVEAILSTLADAELAVCGYGVVDFTDADDAEIRETFSLVDRLGGDYCSLEFPPADEDLREKLLSLSAEFDLQLAIHNHGPEATYSSVDDVAAVLDVTADRRLGACVDTGHFLRSGEHPKEVLSRLLDRVIALHLKDFDDENVETVAGEGRLDVPDLLATLDAETALSQPLVVEYEADPEDPTPAVKAAVDAVRQVTD